MSCGGLRFMATRPEVNRWRERCPADIPLTLVLSVSKYAMRLLIHKLSLFDKMETDDPNYIYKLHHPTGWTGFFAVVSRRGSVSKQLLLVPRVVFSRHQTRFPLSRAVVIATHWLAVGERSLSLDVVNVSWLSEWGNVTAETYDLVHYIPRLTFPGTWNSTWAEFFFFIVEQIFLTEAHPPLVLWQWGRSTSFVCVINRTCNWLNLFFSLCIWQYLKCCTMD